MQFRKEIEVHTTKQDLIERMKELKKRETLIKKKLDAAPEGMLRITHCGKNVRYYHRRLPSDRTGSYIPKTNTGLIKCLAQKDYYEKLLHSIKEEVKAIEAYLRICPDLTAENVYNTLNQPRKEIVVPAFETNESFVKRWQNVKYEGKPFPEDYPILLTDKGERVRSKTELIIANILEKENIPYRYEYPIMLDGLGKIYPDFTVLNVRLHKEYLWEHFGMMDDPDYAEKAVRKITAYNLSGYYSGENLIITSETKTSPLNTLQIKGIINHFIY